jgi:hypothetical protein
VPHIDLPEGIPGIRSALTFRPETAAPLLQLAEVLLRDENTLSRGERELIAAYADGRSVTEEDVALARRHGASDVEIHDTVLIAAAFCMVNRYVDGLATWAPTDALSYQEMATRIVEHGYAAPSS